MTRDGESVVPVRVQPVELLIRGTGLRPDVSKWDLSLRSCLADVLGSFESEV